MKVSLKSARQSGSLLALLVATSLMPQATMAQEAAKAQDTGEKKATLEEIIVTASRRETNLQKESRAVAVVGGDEIRRAAIVEPSAVQNLVPGLTIARNGQQLQVFIRGVGDKTINAATDPAVAINVDGVYYPKSYEGSAAFFDLERIEVLKGPQGTLYGRNASAGALNVISARPKFTLGGFGEVEYGNYNNFRATAALNVPLSAAVALRVSGQVVNRDGYLTDGYNDAKSEALRASLLIQPDADTSLLLTTSYAHMGGKGDAGVIIQRFGGGTPLATVPNPANRWAGPTDPATKARLANTNPGAEAFTFSNGFQNLDVYSLAATFEHRFEHATLTVIPSYVGSRFRNYSAAALMVPTYQDTSSHQYGLETRLSSPNGSRHKWVVGAIGMGEDVKDYYQSGIPLFGTTMLFLPAESPRRDDRTAAAFGEVNFALTDALRFIVGGRYTWEKKIVTGATLSVVGPLGGLPAPFDGALPVDISGKVVGAAGALNIGGQRTDRATNFRAGLEYDLTPASMVYATVATGFKAGGFYNDAAPSNSYAPEKLTAYQIGTKNRFFNNRLQVNLEGFYWDYKNKQETFLGLPSFGVSPILLTKNASTAELYGFDLAVSASLTAQDTLSGDVEYNHTRYGSYVVNTLLGVVDNTGQALVRAPEWSGRVNYRHTQPLGDNGQLLFEASMRFSASYWLSNDYLSLGKQTAFQIYDASLGWQSASKCYGLTAYVKNIGNKAYYSGAVFSPSLTDAGVGAISDPRTYGVRLRASF